MGNFCPIVCRRHEHVVLVPDFPRQLRLYIWRSPNDNIITLVMRGSVSSSSTMNWPISHADKNPIDFGRTRSLFL